MRRWIRETFEQAGEAVMTRKHAQHLRQRRRVGAVQEGADGAALEGLVFDDTITASSPDDPSHCR